VSPARRPRLLAAAGALAWLLAFGWAGRGGTWLPLAGLAVPLSLWLLLRDGETRALLAPSWRTLGLGLAAGVAQVAATYLLYAPAARLLPGLAAGTRDLYALLAAGGLPRTLLAPLVLGVILAEEVVWRGALLSGDGRRWPRLLGFGALYAVVHAPSGSWLLVAVALACGLYWGALRLGTGSLFAAVVAHALWDAVVLFARPLG
jgi:membrane protease YdiL (CAAX protease family)